MSRIPGNMTLRTDAVTSLRTRDGSSEMDLGLEDSMCMPELEEFG